MQLIVAEKPSVGRDLARVLGVPASGRNSLHGDGRVITWCIGHLVELEEPAAYDPRWKAWRMDTLPMLPAPFKLRPVPSTREQLRVVRDLLRERRFSEVVNACDAGREGELIFRYVYELAQSRLPVRRLWISSLTDEAIRQGFAGLRPGAALDALGDAARCRSEADWLVGMNATRAVTIRFRASGIAAAGAAGTSRTAPASTGSERAPTTYARGRRDSKAHGHSGGRGKGWRADLPAVYSIGRVQTPTLAIVVRRELAIRAFQPRDYWEVRGSFAVPTDGGVSAGDQAGRRFTGMWSWRPPGEKTALTRLASRAHADEVVARTQQAATSGATESAPVVERLIQKRSREPAPQLFDLTSLQRTANRRYGLSASRTLEAAQALYERHKVLTYPRTDSRYLPRDMMTELPKLFRGLTRLPAYAPFAQTLVDGDLGAAAHARRIFDDSKVHDHHAIIPTGKVPTAGALGQDEQRLFDLVVRRFLGVFYPDAEFALTEAVIRVGAAGGARDRVASLHPTTGGQTSRAETAPVPGTGDSEDPLLAVLPPPPDHFIARGRIRLVAGWQIVAGLDEAAAATGSAGRDSSAAPAGRGAPEGADTSAPTTLPSLEEGQRLDGAFETLTRQTRPPPRHSEATLLAAMESAGREIDDDALRAAMKDTGLGTPATRAATIETLLKRRFIAREGKQLTATDMGVGLIEGLPVPNLASSELTGAWEARLVRVARGQETRAAFMSDIVRYVQEVTDTLRGPAPRPVGTAAPSPSQTPDIPPPRTASPARTPSSLDLLCPRCRVGKLVAGNRGWGCSQWRTGCPFVIWFELNGKRITTVQLRDLIEKGKTRKAKWHVGGPGAGSPATAGRLILDLAATREQGAARFSPD